MGNKRWVAVVIVSSLIGMWVSRGLAQSSTLKLSEVRFAGAGDQRTIILQFSQPPTTVRSFVLTSPTRLVIDVRGPVGKGSPGPIPVEDTLISRVRTGIHPRRLRVVLDLQTEEAPKFSVEQQQGVVTAVLTAPGYESSEPFSRVLFALPGRTTLAHSTPSVATPSIPAFSEPETKAEEKKGAPIEKRTGGEPPAIAGPASVAKKPEVREQEAVASEKSQVPAPDSQAMLPPQTGQEHLRCGQFLYAKGAVDGAIIHWQETLRLAPQTVKAQHLLGLAFHHRGKVPEAIAALRETVRLTPQDVAAYIHLGRALETRGDVEAAQAAYQKARQLMPTSAYVHDRLGHLNATREKWGEAIQAWQETVRLRPNFATAYANLGEALEKVDRREEALAAYERVLQIDPQTTLATKVRRRVAQLRTPAP